MEQVSIFVTLVIMFFFQLDLLQCDNLILRKPIISPECESVGICDSVENYPTKLVKRLIDKLKLENTIFNYEEVPFTMITHRSGDVEDRTWHEITHKPTQRTRFYTSYEHSFKPKDRKKGPLSLCETKTQLVQPKSAIDINGNWQFIINDSEEPVQVFRIETCRTPKSRCSENISFIPGYDGACIQKMVFREMYYVNETEEIDRTFFKVPTCCSCVLIRKDDDE